MNKTPEEMLKEAENCLAQHGAIDYVHLQEWLLRRTQQLTETAKALTTCVDEYLETAPSCDYKTDHCICSLTISSQNMVEILNGRSLDK